MEVLKKEREREIYFLDLLCLYQAYSQRVLEVGEKEKREAEESK